MADEKKIILFFALVALAFMGSCERLFIEDGSEHSSRGIFNEAWTFTEREYSYFDLKGVDWDMMKTKYESRIGEGISDDSLFNVIGNMLAELKDGHVNLSSPFDRSRYWNWFQDYPENYDQALIERNYYNGHQQYIGSLVYLNLNDIGYISYRSFSQGIGGEHLRELEEALAGKKGVIIDIRNNGGGSTTNVDKLAGFFTNESYVAGKERFKNGPGKNDFTGFVNVEVQPNEDGYHFGGKIALLTNRKCYSASTFFAMYMQANPRCVIIGDQTGGGGGGPAFTELLNGWSLRVSSTQLVDNSGYQVELGVKPDIATDMDSTQALQGIDSILERALVKLRK